MTAAPAVEQYSENNRELGDQAYVSLRYAELDQVGLHYRGDLYADERGHVRAVHPRVWRRADCCGLVNAAGNL